MNNFRSLIIALITFVGAILGGVVGLIGALTSFQQLAALAVVLIVSLGLLVLLYLALAKLDMTEKRLEAEKQHGRDAVQLEILEALNRLIDRSESQTVMQEDSNQKLNKQMLEILKRIESNSNAPNPTRLESPENDLIEDNNNVPSQNDDTKL